VLRWLLAACAVVVGAEVGYLIVANGCARKVLGEIAARADLVIEVGSVRTLYPGHLVVHDLALRDARERWSVHADDGRFSLGVGALLQGAVHVRSASVTGMRVVVEPQLAPPPTELAAGTGRATVASMRGRALITRSGMAPPVLGATVRLDRLEGTLRSVRVGTFELSGPVAVALERGGFGGTAPHVHARFALADAALQHAAATAAILSGGVSLTLGPTTAAAVGTLSGTARLGGRIIGVPRALAPVAPSAPFEGSAFDVMLAFERDAANEGGLRVELGRAVIHHARGETTRLGPGSTLHLAFGGKANPVVHAGLRAPFFEIADRRERSVARLAPLSVSLELTVTANESIAGTEAGLALLGSERDRRVVRRLRGRGRVLGERAELWDGGARIRGAVGAVFELERLEHYEDAVLVGSGAVHLSNVALDSGDSALPSSLELRLDVERALLRAGQSLTVVGTLAAAGGDARAALELARIAPAIRLAPEPRVLAELKGRPFRATASVESGPNATLVREGVFESERARAEGTLLVRNEQSCAAFHVRRGDQAVGVTVDRTGARVFRSPPRGWLERRSRELVVAAARSRWERW